MIVCKTCRQDVTRLGRCENQRCTKELGYLQWKTEPEMNWNHETTTPPRGWRLATIDEFRTFGPKLRAHRTKRIGWYWSSTRSTENIDMNMCYHIRTSREGNYNISRHIWVCFVKDIM
jgi:hypothetical protein